MNSKITWIVKIIGNNSKIVENNAYNVHSVSLLYLFLKNLLFKITIIGIMIIAPVFADLDLDADFSANLKHQ